MQTAASATGAVSPRVSHATSITRTLLAGGVLAGPLYLTVGVTEAFTRPGFDITRHSLSLLSNGELGWIHITNFLVSGLLVLGAAVGLRRALPSGPGRTWAPILLAVYGLGLIGAGVFRADPAQGFPLGTPEDAMTVSTHGLLHLATGGLGFLGLIAATFVMARRFARLGQAGWQWFSIITGLVFFLGFAGIAMVYNNHWSLLGFWIGVVLAWTWVTALSARLRAALPAAR
jgi:hypothetical protein